jgi:NADH:ubiquinone oxidoreductase subunit C
MYGCFLYQKSDNRNLLLDYTFDEHPLLKNYPCVGFKEVFYNPLEECVAYYQNNSVEL